MKFDPETILSAASPADDPADAVVAADWFLEQGDREMAAAALDRAYGLNPEDPHVAAQRAAVLDELAVEEYGLRFRYVPAGTFLMGSKTGDPDERPVHPVRLEAFYMAEIPTTWAAYCRLMGWSEPPNGLEPSSDDEAGRPRQDRRSFFQLHERNKIRRQYCETFTNEAIDWHAHSPNVLREQVGDEQPVSMAEMYGLLAGRHLDQPWKYDRKPMIAVGPEEAEELAEKLSSDSVRYSLPSEAQWEKAARGGRIGSEYAWGDAPPTPELCDFDHFGVFKLGDPRTFPANGYGLYGMCGGVWEWTTDPYWALAYRAAVDPTIARPDAFAERVLRGGSWADCDYMVRVAARMSRAGGSWRAGDWSPVGSPTFGFRLCRMIDGQDRR